MWAVARRAQGLEPNTDPFAAQSAEERYQRNQRCILLHEAKADTPYMDPRTLTRAYGDFHYDKLRRWLLDSDPHLRLQAVDDVTELFAEKREHRVKCLASGLLPILVSAMCTDAVEAIRERAATALEMLVREPGAQEQLLRAATGHASASTNANVVGDMLERLVKEALADSSDHVVVRALRVMVSCHAYTNNYALTQHMIELGAVPRVLALVEGSANPLVRAVACSALVPMFDVKEAHVVFQRAGGMRVVTAAISAAGGDMLVSEAAHVVSRAAEWPQGKRDAVSCGTLSALLPSLGNPNLSVRVAVAEALAQVTVWEPAKIQAVETEGFADTVAELLSREDERDVIAHVAKLVYHLAEHPVGRTALRQCKPRLVELLGFADSEDLSVRLALENSIEILSRP